MRDRAVATRHKTTVLSRGAEAKGRSPDAKAATLAAGRPRSIAMSSGALPRPAVSDGPAPWIAQQAHVRSGAAPGVRPGAVFSGAMTTISTPGEGPPPR